MFNFNLKVSFQSFLLLVILAIAIDEIESRPQDVTTVTEVTKTLPDKVNPEENQILAAKTPKPNQSTMRIMPDGSVMNDRSPLDGMQMNWPMTMSDMMGPDMPMSDPEGWSTMGQNGPKGPLGDKKKTDGKNDQDGAESKVIYVYPHYPYYPYYYPYHYPYHYGPYW